MTAAIAELAGRGYEGTSLTRIAERAGVSKGLIWHYFSGKEDLMDATARATVANIRDEIASTLDLTESVPDVLRAALRQLTLTSHTGLLLEPQSLGWSAGL